MKSLIYRAAPVCAFVTIVFAQGCASARYSEPPADARAYKGPPTTAAITPRDLRTRIYIFADDSMRGRAAGTVDNLRGAAYIERELKRLGLKPAGENGTYFQDVPLYSRGLSSNASLTIDGRTFRLTDDFIPRDMGPGMRSIDGATAVYGGVWGDTSTYISREAAAGKIVVLTAPSGSAISRFGAGARFNTAAGIAAATLDAMPIDTRAALATEKSMDEASKAATSGRSVPLFFYASRALASAMFGGASIESLKPGASGRKVSGQIGFEQTTPPPGRNVIAIIPGSDPALRGQYVALGAHNDHEPPRPVAVDHDSVRAYNSVIKPEGAESGSPVPTAGQMVKVRAILDSLRKIRGPRADSIMNGADDDGTGSMALLEIAEAFSKAKVKPKRSLLFVWHTAEELGMVGSNYFTTHPTVPLDSIVTQLNIDMIGRGGSNDAVHDVKGELSYGSPDFVEVIGSRKLSTELGDIVENVNSMQSRPLVLSKVFDTPGEPHQMYCRSDHYMYARFGIPITFFFTSVHRDYHQVTDEPQYIDYTHYSRIVNFVRDIADRVANLDHRPVVDKPKPAPGAACVA
jgi:hypothetical protein